MHIGSFMFLKELLVSYREKQHFMHLSIEKLIISVIYIKKDFQDFYLLQIMCLLIVLHSNTMKHH